MVVGLRLASRIRHRLPRALRPACATSPRQRRDDTFALVLACAIVVGRSTVAPARPPGRPRSRIGVRACATGASATLLGPGAADATTSSILGALLVAGALPVWRRRRLRRRQGCLLAGVAVALTGDLRPPRVPAHVRAARSMPEPDLALDRLIHEPGRLAILTVLSSASDADFLFVQRATGLTEGQPLQPPDQARGGRARRDREALRRPQAEHAARADRRGPRAHRASLGAAGPAQGNSAANEPCASRSSASVALIATSPGGQRQAVPADLAEHLRAERLERLGAGRRRRSRDRATRRRAAPRRRRPARSSRARRRRRRGAHSASATARPPSAMSCALLSVPARTASRTASCAERTAEMSASGRPSGSASPRSFASSEPGSAGANGPTRPTASPSARERQARRRARRRAARRTIPTTGVG